MEREKIKISLTEGLNKRNKSFKKKNPQKFIDQSISNVVSYNNWDLLCLTWKKKKEREEKTKNETKQKKKNYNMPL